MSWNSWSEFWSMGGYGLYVWGSYLVTVLFMGMEIVLLGLRRASILQHLGRLRRGNGMGMSRFRDES